MGAAPEILLDAPFAGDRNVSRGIVKPCIYCQEDLYHMIFASEVLRSFLQRKQIATLEELKQILGTTSTMTVFRKLKKLGYRTSYSHRGKYYTLAEIPQFDEPGLWSCRAVWFSRDGTLLATVQRFVEQAPAGLTASEVQAVLNVEVKQPLLQLYQHKGVDRHVVEGVYV
jgi:hypothetical protein